jgi:cell division septation protein DedD
MRVFLELNKDEATKVLDTIKTFSIESGLQEEKIAKLLANPSAPPVQTPPVNPVQPLPEVVNYVAPTPTPTPTPQTVTKEEIAKLAVQLIDLGRRDELIALLSSFNAKSIGELDPKDYSNFANFLKAKGCK